MHLATIYILSIVFIATLIRSTFGFGEALIAVPLLALQIPIEISAPLAVLISVTVAGVAVAQDFRKIHVGSASWMVASTLFGIPLGLWLLTHVNSSYVKSALGLLIILFSIFSLIGRGPAELKRDSRAGLLISGFFAGVLGGAYGMNGPPLVVYATMRRWSPQHTRATLQAYFLPAGIITLAGYALAGLLNREVMSYYLISLPAAFTAIWLGRTINLRIQGGRYLRYVYLGLTGIGVLLLLQGLQHLG